MQRRLLLVAAAANLLLLLPAVCVQAQTQAQAQTAPLETHVSFVEGAAVSVPLELKGGIPFIKALVNGKPVTMTLDNIGDIDVMPLAAAQRSGVVSVAPPPGGSSAFLGVIKHIQIGNCVLESVPAAIVPSAGWTSDGLLRTDLFQKAVVRLDFRTGQAIISDPALYEPSEKAVVLPLKILSEGGALVEATINGSTGLFVVRAGDWPSLKLDAGFIAREGLRDLYGKGIRVGTQVDNIRAETFDLGGFRVAGLTVELPKESPDDNYRLLTSDGQIGNSVLKKFIVTFDYPHRRLCLESPDKSIRHVNESEAADYPASQANETLDEAAGRREIRRFRQRFADLEFTQGVGSAYKTLSLPELTVTIRPFNKVQGVLTQEAFLQFLHPKRSKSASSGVSAPPIAPSMILPLLATANSSSDSLSAFDENVPVTPWQPDKIEVKPTEIVVTSSPSVETLTPVAGDASGATAVKRLNIKATLRSVYRRGGDCPMLASIDLIGFAMSIDGSPAPDATIRDMFDPAPPATLAAPLTTR